VAVVSASDRNKASSIKAKAISLKANMLKAKVSESRRKCCSLYFCISVVAPKI